MREEGAEEEYFSRGINFLLSKLAPVFSTTRQESRKTTFLGLFYCGGHAFYYTIYKTREEQFQDEVLSHP